MTDIGDGLTVFRLPRSHWHCTLSGFQWDGVKPTTLQVRVDTFLAEVVSGAAPHLVLTGTPGIGKTHLGVAIYRWAAAQLGTVLVTWISVPAFCEAVKRSYEPGSVDPWVDIEEARRLVVLDDLFGRELTAHEKDQIITRLLDTIYTNGAAALVTMNPSIEEAWPRLPAHEISRLLSDAAVVPITAVKDWRLGATQP